MAIDRFPKAAYELGELREDFRVSRTDLILTLLFIPILLVVLGPVVLLRVLKILAPANQLEWLLGIGGVVSVVGFVVSAAIAFVRTWPQRHLRVLLFDEGLVYIHRDVIDVRRWDEIAWTTDGYVFEGNAAIRQFVVHGPSGELVFDESIGPLNDFHSMVAAIYARVSQRLLAQAMADLKAGARIDFGSIQVAADGIFYDDRVLAWSGFDSIALQGLDIMIAQPDTRTPWAKVPRGVINNEQMLIELAMLLGKPGELAVIT